MEKNFIKRIITISLALLILTILAIVLQEQYHKVYESLRYVFLILTLILGIMFYREFKSENFNNMLKKVDQYYNDEQNQITMRQMIIFDIKMLIVGIAVFVVKYCGFDLIKQICSESVIEKVNVLLFIIIMFYVLGCFLAGIYTLAVIKENYNKKK